jgi:hypothetical protein
MKLNSNIEHLNPKQTQTSNVKIINLSRFLNLYFEHLNLFGIWNLEFGIFNRGLFR